MHLYPFTGNIDIASVPLCRVTGLFITGQLLERIHTHQWFKIKTNVLNPTQRIAHPVLKTDLALAIMVYHHGTN